MMKRLSQYAQTLSALIKADFFIFKADFHNGVIDTCIATAVQMLVTIYILPYFGLVSNFGTFMLGSFVASSIFWQSYSFVAPLVGDLSGEKKITYELMLPIPTILIFLRLMISFSVHAILFSAAVIPLGKLFLGSQFVLADISFISLILMFIIGSLFVASFSLFMVSLIYNMGQLSRVWTRFLFPLWMLGAFNFSWFSMYTMIPMLGYISLANPMVYFHEGFRTAVLNPPDSLSLLICIPALIFFIFVFATFGIRRIKARLDCF